MHPHHRFPTSSLPSFIHPSIHTYTCMHVTRLVVGREELVLAQGRHGLLELRLMCMTLDDRSGVDCLWSSQGWLYTYRERDTYTHTHIRRGAHIHIYGLALSAWEEESLEEVHNDHSTRSSGVGSDHVISTCSGIHTYRGTYRGWEGGKACLSLHAHM